MIVAIDGPAGAGKSTVAHGLAEQLGLKFLDTGAMYRAVALHMLENNIELHDHSAVARTASEIELFVDGELTKLGNRDVSRLIRTTAVSEAASKVATIPEVRQLLVRLQREVAATGNYVCEGRDQGSVVFPNAQFKFFVTASIEGRAQRRLKEEFATDDPARLEQIIAELRQRDERDSNRTIGALIKAADAIEIHTDDMTIDQVIEYMLRIIERDSDLLRVSRSSQPSA